MQKFLALSFLKAWHLRLSKFRCLSLQVSYGRLPPEKFICKGCGIYNNNNNNNNYNNNNNNNTFISNDLGKVSSNCFSGGNSHTKNSYLVYNHFVTNYL
jgi:hypothetical protein